MRKYLDYKRGVWLLAAALSTALIVQLHSMVHAEKLGDAAYAERETTVEGHVVEEGVQVGDSGEGVVEVMAEPDWKLILVNRYYAVPDEYDFMKRYYNGLAVDDRIYDSLVTMIADGEKTGCDFVVCSAYRSIARQTERYRENVAKYQGWGYSYERACELTERTLAYPGYSEHHTGLAVDIVAKTYQVLDEGYQNTAEAAWLAEHAHEYGFILRYPADKTEITGIDYEPWHFRYVGVEAATEIWEAGVCLEEYVMPELFTGADVL
jgi:D-alanyl-D-alanine carboxypeptidase